MPPEKEPARLVAMYPVRLGVADANLTPGPIEVGRTKTESRGAW